MLRIIAVPDPNDRFAADAFDFPTANAVVLEFLDRHDRGDPLVGLELDQVGDGFAPAGDADVGDLQGLQPVDPADVGEEHQVGVGRADGQVLDDVLGLHADALAALAAAHLEVIGRQRGALDVARLGEEDDDVLLLDQVLGPDVGDAAEIGIAQRRRVWLHRHRQGSRLAVRRRGVRH